MADKSFGTRSIYSDEYLGLGDGLVGIVTQIVPGIGIDIAETQIPGKGVVEIQSYRPVGRTIYVSQNGDDDNTGLAENYPKRTIKSAASVAFSGDTIKVFPGVYVEENPILLKKTVSVEGTELRNCVVTPKYLDRDIFYVNNGCHITDMSFIGPDVLNNSAIVSFERLTGVSDNRFFDGSRMIRLNLDYIAQESVGFLTSGFSGLAGNHKEQDAARLIDLNIDFIAAEAVGFLTSPSGLNFTIPGPGTTEDCSDDIKDIFRSVSYDLKANSNRKSIGAGNSYFENDILSHITGVTAETIATLEYAVGVATHVINNVALTASYQLGPSTISQTFDNSIIQIPGGCVSVASTISELVGIITSMISAGTTSVAPPVRYGVVLEETDRFYRDVKNTWKAICFDITRGGNSKCVNVAKSHFDESWQLNSDLLKNQEEVNQLIKTLEYSYNIGRSVVNNCTWGSFPVGIGSSVSNAQYNPISGITTITLNDHNLLPNDPIKIEGLEFECENGSPSFPVSISTAFYNNITGITTITTSSNFNVFSGDRIRLENLVFECDSGGGPATALYPSGNYGYDFTVIDVFDSTNFTVNVGPSTLSHTYVSGGNIFKLNTPTFGITTAVYDNITGITTIITKNSDTSYGPAMYIEPGQNVKLENLVFECDSGGGPATALYPSGNNGYSFNVISTTEDKYVDAANLISLNRQEIIDKSLAQIAIGHSDFYFPNRDNIQTTRFSRFKDSYRLIQQNRTEIVNTAWDAAVLEYPSISTTELKCKRDLGYFVDAVSTDIFTGGNYYSSEFVKQYFNNGSPISNGLVGEESESVYAFTQARDLMKNAITNQLTVQDLTITADPLTGSNTSTESCANVQNAIDTLTTLITTVISEGSLDTLNQININNGIFFSGENKCRRDIGYIVDALIKDIKYGTNKHIREATRAYFNANGTPITNGLVGEEAPSVTAFNAIRDYAKLAITNNLNKKDLSITPDPITGDNTDPSSCANVQTTIDNLIGILTYHVLSGSLTSFPTLSVSNTIKVNVGVSTLAHTYVSGGTVTSKYTTNLFPDGSFGYIFPVKSVVDSNTFEFVGGKSDIYHTYVPGTGTIQKYRNFKNDSLQVKDLGIQVDPQTGFNNSLNSCANVISALNSCIGIVTTIVGYGSSSGISTSYPGNSGRGFTTVVDVKNAIYDETSGKTTITAPGFSAKKGDLIEIRDLLFECSSGLTTTTQIFPSGKNDYDFYIDKINSDGTFDIYVGVSTIPHTYVSGGYIIDRSIKVFDAEYDNTSGIVTITAPGAYVRPGDLVSIKDLEFICSSGAATTTIYPTEKNGYNFVVQNVEEFANKFSLNVGLSTIPHSYVSGGIVLPAYSKGVGPITQGPYVRNCTNFIGKSTGMLVDGFNAELGDQDDIGVTGAMSVDSYTQYNQGGIGVSITNGAYCQLVSIFTICSDTAIYTSTGGQCDITNSNSSFGNYGLVSVGVGDNTSKSIYRYTGNVYTQAEAEQDTIVVSGIGSNRPYDGQALYFGNLYNSVDTIQVIDGGSGYSELNPPRVIFDSPEPGGIVAEGSVNIENGKITSVDVISSGSQYLSTPSISFDGPVGAGASAIAIMRPIYYNIERASIPVAGISTIVLTTNLNTNVSSGTTVYFSRLSLQIASSHSFEWVGAGTEILKAKPGLGGVSIQENEVIKIDGGEVVYTSTDQAGNFRIGDDVTVNQLTGTISGRAFSQSLLNTVTPLLIALGR
jgi:hypothetical protein